MEEYLDIRQLMNRELVAQDIGTKYQEDNTVLPIKQSKSYVIVGLDDKENQRESLYTITKDQIIIVDNAKNEESSTTYTFNLETKEVKKNNQAIGNGENLLKRLSREFMERNEKTEIFELKREI